LDAFNQHFKANPNSGSYFAVVDVDGNLKSLLALVAQARKIKKAVYLFSVDPDGAKVSHVNYLPEHDVKDGFDAKVWANTVTEVLGGKVSWFRLPLPTVNSLYRILQAGGQTDSAQGVGVNVDKLNDALGAAEKAYQGHL
jgi:alanyl-tRNA synthetase